jgi:hypothetical protein
MEVQSEDDNTEIVEEEKDEKTAKEEEELDEGESVGD